MFGICSRYLTFMGTDRCKLFELFQDILRTFESDQPCSDIAFDSSLILQFHVQDLKNDERNTFNLFLFFMVSFFLEFCFFFNLSFLHFVLLGRLTEFSHFLLELFIFVFDFLLFLIEINFLSTL